MLTRYGLRFIERWRKEYVLRTEGGKEGKAWELVRGKRAQAAAKLWHAQQKRLVPVSWLSLPVRHPEVPEARLFLIVVRSTAWQTPWYLLTNEEIVTPEDSLRVILAYTRRWQIEWCFRFEKSELGIEHARIRDWQDQLNLLAIVTVVYAFFLSVLEVSMQAVVSWLLRFWDHPTGHHARSAGQPLYRLRRALARLWYEYRPGPARPCLLS